jgi:hypothetical protein
MTLSLPAPDRPGILLAAALAVATPLLAGSMAWSYIDEDQRHGAAYMLLYWPSILLDRLPPAAAAAFTLSALPMVLMYFGGYLLLIQVARAAWRALR